MVRSDDNTTHHTKGEKEKARTVYHSQTAGTTGMHSPERKSPQLVKVKKEKLVEGNSPEETVQQLGFRIRL